MPCNIKNPAAIDLNELEPHIQGMYDYFDQKVGFNKPPTMIFDSDPSNQSNVLGKTAYYDPSTLEIHIYSDGRHPKDMLRSIAHELIHHQQNLEGRLNVGGYHGEGYYLKNNKLKKIEQEAMKYGNELMREYEDSLKLKEKKNMSLKEWKNNELSGLLMKRFGILKEEKKPDADGDGVPDWADKKEGDDAKEANEGMDYKRDDELEESADKNDGLEGGKKTSYGHEKPDEKEKERLKEDSGEDEKDHYEDNRMSDDDHIKAIEHHLAALRKDKNYDDDHEELEETVSGRHDPRNRRDDDPRLRPMEESEGMEDEDDLLTDKEAKESSKEDSIGVANESLKETMRRALKKNKKLRLRFK